MIECDSFSLGLIVAGPYMLPLTVLDTVHQDRE